MCPMGRHLLPIPVAHDREISGLAEGGYAIILCWISGCSATNPRAFARVVQIPGAVSENSHFSCALSIPVSCYREVASHAIGYAGILCWIAGRSATNPRACARVVQIPGAISENP